ncbi:hypothetical protein CRG98_038540 [Punica granatum]|uniref:Uncharacterized protein n=1 Tax=Punica granatum TaxID=22663 RepID=A0A2I0IAI8_PUNGR|nr:hypothetical protein CRG98_038540 [Punica granatum]
MATASVCNAVEARWSMASLRSALPSVSTSTPTSIRFSGAKSSPSLSSLRKPLLLEGSFTGLCPVNPLLSLGLSVSALSIARVPACYGFNALVRHWMFLFNWNSRVTGGSTKSWLGGLEGCQMKCAGSYLFFVDVSDFFSVLEDSRP